MKFVVGTFSVLLTVVTASAAQALGVPPVVIGHVQAGGETGSSQELVSLYNNGDATVDITGWCLTNKNTTDDVFLPFACFESDDPYIRVVLPPRNYALAVSGNYAESSPAGGEIVYDVVYEPTGPYGDIIASKDTISLYDSDKSLVDTVAWLSELGSKKVLQRKPADGDPLRLIDTDSLLLSDDFMKVNGPVGVLSGVVLERQVVDMCGNLPLVQEDMPLLYGYDEAGNCELLEVDVCPNLPYIQIAAPQNYLFDETGACQPDVCPNITGLQLIVPLGYAAVDGECAKLESRELLITEVLPNVAGADAGREFIEFYNPHDTSVELGGYVLLAGKNLEKTAALPSLTLLPKSYHVLSDISLGLTLLNTANRLALVAPAGNTVSETSYVDAPDDESWALFGKEWRYTDRVTSGAANEPPYTEMDDTDTEAVSAVLPACAAGKYRHPITNRCRNIETDTNMLVACDADEYRNPETNRCRKTAVLAAALVPCRAGYERNPETNRCRSIVASVSTLTPCKDGYERNPETNRCRKVAAGAATLKPCQQGYERNPLTNRCRKASGAVAASTTPAALPPPAADASSPLSLNTALLATAGIGAVGYGVYEWRRELGRAAVRITRLLARK